MEPPAGIQLIVGLGNPGAEYEHTRHNAGVWFVEGLAGLSHTVLRRDAKFHGAHGLACVDDYECHLLIPTTYMNHSGRAIKAFSHFYKIPPHAILVVHDELDLSIGDVRLKYDGGAGGHNGLTDIINQLHTRQFYRLRIGIGRPQHSTEVVDYVLKPPRKTERTVIDKALEKAYEVMPLVLSGQYQKAMNKLHV